MSDSFTPIIVPVHTPPQTCPSCGNLESKKTICRHCDYEYRNDEITFMGVVSFIALIIAVLWIIITMFAWLMDFDHRSLVEILLAEWKWLSKLRIW